MLLHSISVDSSRPRGEVPTIGIAQAAQLCKKHEATVRRWCKKGDLPGAHQSGPNESDPWVIPVSALIAVGWCTQDNIDKLDQRLNPDLQHLANRIVDLEAELVAERARRESVEQRLAQSETEVDRVWGLLERLVPVPPPSVLSNEGGA